MAGDPQNAVLLLGLGVDELSVSVYDVPRVKAAIRSVRYEAVRALAAEALRVHVGRARARADARARSTALLPSFLVQERHAGRRAPAGDA